METNEYILNNEPGSKIVAVTSDVIITQLLTERLGNAYELLTANTGRDGIDILLAHCKEACAVILDLQVSDLDGIAILRQIRSQPLTALVPVVVLSSKADTEQEGSFLKAGADDYISRPFNENVFLHRVLNLSRRQTQVFIPKRLVRDEVTGVYSKRAFAYHAETVLAANPNEKYDLVISDIDHFKWVNAIYGEGTADALLKKLASFLQEHSAEGLCGRYGPDCFVWVQKSDAESRETFERLFADFAAISPVPDVVVRCGIYANVDRRMPINKMCDNALFALNSIKTEGKEIIAYYDGPLSQRHYKEQYYAARFQKALKDNSFFLVYQPKYDSHTNKVVGAEALVRWENPDGSVNMPGEFLRVFEANGMITELDEYVFRCVCRQQKRWHDAGLPMFPVSVNLSRNSMHKKDRAAVYSAIADEYGVDKQFLPIEITETTATDSIAIQKHVEAFKREGFPLHMDDFGSEHSSLQTLNLLDFDVVKLDKGLIDFIGDKVGEMILTYIMALSGELGIRTVAEGVETKQQLDFLVENGCDQIQGYYFSKPLPPEEFKAKISDNLAATQLIEPIKENLYILSRTSHFEKMMTQRMLPRIPGGFFIYEENEDERIIYSNAYLWKLFGCQDEEEFMEHVHGSFRGIVSPEELERVEESISLQILGSSEDMDYVEYSIVRKDGTRVPVVDYGHLERTGKKNLFYVFIYRKDK